MNKNQKGFLSIPLVLAVLAILSVGVYIKVYPKNLVSEPIPSPETGNTKPTPNPENVACTMDAKMCPDGSYVGRVAPNCEFSECPSTVMEEATTASLNQRIFLGGGVYVTPLQVVSDSRCPVDVTCIWAGEVLLKLKLEKDGNTKEVEIKEGGTVNFAPVIISLSKVTPENNTKKPITEKDYKFTFSMAWMPD